MTSSMFLSITSTKKSRRAFICVILTTLYFLIPKYDCIAPRRPPNYSQYAIPDTSFTCEDKVTGGYYVDEEAYCQLFHVCLQVSEYEFQDFRFLCPNNTLFDQQHLVCTNWYDVTCNHPDVHLEEQTSTPVDSRKTGDRDEGSPGSGQGGSSTPSFGDRHRFDVESAEEDEYNYFYYEDEDGNRFVDYPSSTEDERKSVSTISHEDSSQKTSTSNHFLAKSSSPVKNKDEERIEGRNAIFFRGDGGSLHVNDRRTQKVERVKTGEERGFQVNNRLTQASIEEDNRESDNHFIQSTTPIPLGIIRSKTFTSRNVRNGLRSKSRRFKNGRRKFHFGSKKFKLRLNPDGRLPKVKSNMRFRTVSDVDENTIDNDVTDHDERSRNRVRDIDFSSIRFVKPVRPTLNNHFEAEPLEIQLRSASLKKHNTGSLQNELRDIERDIESKIGDSKSFSEPKFLDERDEFKEESHSGREVGEDEHEKVLPRPAKQAKARKRSKNRKRNKKRHPNVGWNVFRRKWTKDCSKNPINCRSRINPDGKKPRVKSDIKARDRNYYNFLEQSRKLATSSKHGTEKKQTSKNIVQTSSDLDSNQRGRFRNVDKETEMRFENEPLTVKNIVKVKKKRKQKKLRGEIFFTTTSTRPTTVYIETTTSNLDSKFTSPPEDIIFDDTLVSFDSSASNLITGSGNDVGGQNEYDDYFYVEEFKADDTPTKLIPETTTTAEPRRQPKLILQSKNRLPTKAELLAHLKGTSIIENLPKPRFESNNRPVPSSRSIVKASRVTPPPKIDVEIATFSPKDNIYSFGRKEVTRRDKPSILGVEQNWIEKARRAVAAVRRKLKSQDVGSVRSQRKVKGKYIEKPRRYIDIREYRNEQPKLNHHHGKGTEKDPTYTNVSPVYERGGVNNDDLDTHNVPNNLLSIIPSNEMIHVDNEDIGKETNLEKLITSSKTEASGSQVFRNKLQQIFTVGKLDGIKVKPDGRTPNVKSNVKAHKQNEQYPQRDGWSSNTFDNPMFSTTVDPFSSVSTDVGKVKGLEQRRENHSATTKRVIPVDQRLSGKEGLRREKIVKHTEKDVNEYRKNIMKKRLQKWKRLKHINRKKKHIDTRDLVKIKSDTRVERFNRPPPVSKGGNVETSIKELPKLPLVTDQHYKSSDAIRQHSTIDTTTTDYVITRPTPLPSKYVEISREKIPSLPKAKNVEKESRFTGEQDIVSVPLETPKRQKNTKVVRQHATKKPIVNKSKKKREYSNEDHLDEGSKFIRKQDNVSSKTPEKQNYTVKNMREHTTNKPIVNKSKEKQESPRIDRKKLTRKSAALLKSKSDVKHLALTRLNDKVEFADIIETTTILTSTILKDTKLKNPHNVIVRTQSPKQISTRTPTTTTENSIGSNNLRTEQLVTRRSKNQFKNRLSVKPSRKPFSWTKKPNSKKQLSTGLSKLFERRRLKKENAVADSKVTPKKSNDTQKTTNNTVIDELHENAVSSTKLNVTRVMPQKKFQLLELNPRRKENNTTQTLFDRMFPAKSDRHKTNGEKKSAEQHEDGKVVDRKKHRLLNKLLGMKPKRKKLGSGGVAKILANLLTLRKKTDTKKIKSAITNTGMKQDTETEKSTEMPKNATQHGSESVDKSRQELSESKEEQGKESPSEKKIDDGNNKLKADMKARQILPSISKSVESTFTTSVSMSSSEKETKNKARKDVSKNELGSVLPVKPFSIFQHLLNGPVLNARALVPPTRTTQVSA